MPFLGSASHNWDQRPAKSLFPFFVARRSASSPVRRRGEDEGDPVRSRPSYTKAITLGEPLANARGLAVVERIRRLELSESIETLSGFVGEFGTLLFRCRRF